MARGKLRIGHPYQRLLLLLAFLISVSFMIQAWVVPPSRKDLRHFRRERSLQRYLDSIQLLIEPSSSELLCEGAEDVPLLVMVSSAPDHLDSRQAIRQTWAQHLPTFFVLGLDGPEIDEQLVDIYIEAKQYGDMVVYDFVDHYQNLTLKTVLMLQWSSHRCPQAGALFKTDDDVFVNPWMLRTVVKEHEDHQLIGYKLNDTRAHRNENSKWYLPRWLYPWETIPHYLSGTGYIINGEYIEEILKTAQHTPMINLEDVYLTLLVADRLKLTLTHDRRLSPFKPWIKTGCSYWNLASVHSLTPDEIVYAWSGLVTLVKEREMGSNVCSFLGFLSSDLFLFRT